MTYAAVINMLRRDIDEVGSLRAWARARKVSAPFVSRVLNGKKEASDRVLAALGVERCEPVYRRKK